MREFYPYIEEDEVEQKLIMERIAREDIRKYARHGEVSARYDGDHPDIGPAYSIQGEGADAGFCYCFTLKELKRAALDERVILNVIL